jgi:hypothetical protein
VNVLNPGGLPNDIRRERQAEGLDRASEAVGESSGGGLRMDDIKMRRTKKARLKKSALTSSD